MMFLVSLDKDEINRTKIYKIHRYSQEEEQRVKMVIIHNKEGEFAAPCRTTYSLR